VMLAGFGRQIKRRRRFGGLGAGASFAGVGPRGTIDEPMNDHYLPEEFQSPEIPPPEPELIIATVVDEGPPPVAALAPRRWRLRLILPLVLFVLTCATTFLAGAGLQILQLGPGGVAELKFQHGQVFRIAPGWAIYLHAWAGCVYAGSLMTILMCHEMGHFLQARRYGVPASLPFFIPVPIGPIGTFGAVIGMSSRIRDRRALFDIGITGPLAGLVPTLICCIVGVQLAHAGPVAPTARQYGDPLLLKLLYRWEFGPLPEGWDVAINPLLWAGWVGLLVTAINLIPIGQLDGGHVLYAMMRRQARGIATVLLVAAAVGVVVFGYVWWTLMLVLLFLMGPKHPPTARDDVPLGFWRYVLGWLALAFIAIGFTPNIVVKF
jgi:Zn-dependent protease